MPIALRQIAVNASRWQPIRLPSVKAVRCFEDGELDFVFIDGEHSYKTVKADNEAWWPKIRSGGLLIGHDYDPKRFPDVCRAVDEFCAASASRLQLGQCLTCPLGVRDLPDSRAGEPLPNLWSDSKLCPAISASQYRRSPTMAETLKIVALSRFKVPATLSCCAV